MQNKINKSTLEKQRNLWLPLSIFSAIFWAFTIIGLINVHLALVVGAVASAKGRSASKWYFYGVWIWPLALIHIACLSERLVIDDIGPEGIQINQSVLRAQRKRWLPLSVIATIIMALTFLPLRAMLAGLPFNTSAWEELFREYASLGAPLQDPAWETLFWDLPWLEIGLLWEIGGVIFSILMAFAISYVAFAKRYSASKWFFYGVWLWFIALIHIICMPKRSVVRDAGKATTRSEKEQEDK